MTTLDELIGIAIVGLVIGGLGRLAIPGYQPIGCFLTMLVGIGGSIIGAFAARVLLPPGHGHGIELVLEIAGAALLVWLIAGRPRRVY